ncbi:MAG: RNA polymerase sigma factor [Candidatus Marinimicrobia bacterium]|nr:RNA polymerase sigma factor [Candidatus Neomarinimicrobiota bacterium]MBT4993454.1 RNA polymerase sigma factor [Candidatus Neomarinimicrobiota bacterium]MBT7828843.1 RNA polymerase sigma factor [Candidatus Neomarinimicrobiota bacterium]
MKKPDIVLFEKVQSRDSRAFNQLMRDYSPELYNFILRIVSNTEDAQDILQDTFVRVWEKSHQFKGNSSVKTWIFRIAINLSYTHLKKRNRWGLSVLDEIKTLISGSDPVQDTEKEFNAALLADSLAYLTPRQHAVVVARIYQDLPFAQIAKAVGCSENSAKVHFHEAKKRIEAYIKRQVGEDG